MPEVDILYYKGPSPYGTKLEAYFANFIPEIFKYPTSFRKAYKILVRYLWPHDRAGQIHELTVESKEDIAIQLTEGWLLGASPTVLHVAPHK
jgi:hypothetical protein